MTNFSARRAAGFLSALLLTAGLILLQALIGGRVMLFAFPGYFLLGAAGVIGLVHALRAKVAADPFCLYATAIFFGYILIRALTSPAYFARPDLFAVMASLVVYGLTITASSSSTGRAAIFAALLAFAVIHVLIGLIQFSHGDNFMPIPFLQRVDYGPRASGFYVCPNHLAGLLEVVGIFGISLIVWGRWPMWAKVMAAYASAVCYVGVALTGSRGGYLSVMASFVVFALLSIMVMRTARPEKWFKFGAITLACLIACALLATILIQQSGYLSQRAGNIIDPKNMRIELWRAAIQQWQLQPVLGTGSGTYRFYGRQFRAKEMQNDPIDVHNDYLHLLCEYGLIGAAGFLAFFVAHLRQGWRNFKLLSRRVADSSKLSSDRLALNVGSLAAIAAYVVHSALDFNLHIPANAVLLALVFGIVANLGVKRDSKETPARLLSIPRISAALLGIALIIQSVRLFPGQYFTERARTSLRDEDPASAILFAQKAVARDPADPEAFLYLGRALIAVANRSDNPEKRSDGFAHAITAYQEAQRLAPLDGTYPLNLAYAYDRIGRFAEAETMFELARSRDPYSSAVAELYRAHLDSRQKAESGKAAPL